MPSKCFRSIPSVENFLSTFNLNISLHGWIAIPLKGQFVKATTNPWRKTLQVCPELTNAKEQQMSSRPKRKRAGDYGEGSVAENGAEIYSDLGPERRQPVQSDPWNVCSVGEGVTNL